MDSPLRASRYVRRFHEFSLPTQQESRWCEQFNAILDEHDFDLVIPATEPAVFAMHRHRSQIVPHDRIALLNDRAFSVAFDKAKIQQLAERLEVPVPRSQLVQTANDAEQFLSHQPGRVVAKPLCSVSSSDLSQKQFVRTFASGDDCREFVRHNLSMGEAVLLQEHISGHGEGVEFIAHNGRILSAFQHQRLHETSGIGSTYRQSVRLDPRLLEATRRIVKAVDYTGVGMCEFRVDPESGRWVLLEVNGRFWGSLSLAVATGADFPWYLYQMLVEGEDVFPQLYEIGVRSRQLRTDIRWMWRSFKQRLTRQLNCFSQETGWQINDIRLSQLFAHLLRLTTLQDGLDTFSWDDPGPAWKEARQVLSSSLKQLGARTSREQTLSQQHSTAFAQTENVPMETAT
jgi:predicted ATP-grasp superfamily ATP-dependent carboligase